MTYIRFQQWLNKSSWTKSLYHHQPGFTFNKWYSNKQFKLITELFEDYCLELKLK